MAIFNGTDRVHGNADARNDMGRCCLRCKTPYGHSALAGVCCHTGMTESEEVRDGRE